MPYPHPTLTELRTQAQQDVLGDPSIAGPFLRVSNTRVIARNNADFTALEYGYLDWIALQCTPFTATGEYLEAWAALKGVFRKPPVAAELQAQFPGTVGSGAEIPEGSSVFAADGQEYTVENGAAVDDATGFVTVAIEATTEGAESNQDTGTVCALGTAIPGILANGVIIETLTEGADVESDDDLRSRMLQAYANPPQGGARSDYVTWALQVPGVTRAWCAPNAMGPGTVSVYFMMDETEADNGGFPQGTNGVSQFEPRDVAATGNQLEVADHIFPLRPVTALVYAVAPTPQAIPFTIKGVPVAMQPQVTVAIADALMRLATPGGVTLDDNSLGGVVQINDIWAAIEAVPDSGDYIVVSPAVDIVTGPGALAVLGVITWL
jgi:uncharacterized phage protein gp47/JayE